VRGITGSYKNVPTQYRCPQKEKHTHTHTHTHTQRERERGREGEREIDRERERERQGEREIHTTKLYKTAIGPGGTFIYVNCPLCSLVVNATAGCSLNCPHLQRAS
jgi:hypothetical protein